MMETGIVKFYNDEKGFGFITPDDGKKDIFFHYTSIESGFKNFKKGEKVSFEVIQGIKGLQAIEIKLF